MRILAIIPARGGSKGIPRKNLVEIAGHPLIYYSLETARQLEELGVIDRVMVSTDDQEIAEVSQQLGADVPFMRPAEAATDQSKSIEFILHCLDEFDSRGEQFDAVMLLQPTSPVRDSEAIKEAVVRFKAGNHTSMISCYVEEYVNELVMYKRLPDGTLQPLNSDHNKGVRRQDATPTLVRNGAVYLTQVSYLRRYERIVSDNPLLLEMSKFDSIDVDTVDDIKLLRLRFEYEHRHS